MSNLRKAVLLLTLALAGLSGLVALALFRSDRAGEPGAPGATEKEAKLEGLGDRRPLWSEVTLRSATDSPADRLRRKRTAGHDSFRVESHHEEIKKRLSKLAAFLRGEEGRESIETLLAPGFRAEPFLVEGGKALHREKRIRVFENPEPGTARLDRDAFADRIEGFFRERKVYRAELKVVEIIELAGTARTVAEDEGAEKSEGEGRPRSALRSRVHYTVACEGGSGARDQWSGEILLTWSPAGKIERWETESSVHARVESLPFADVTEEALGENRSYGEILSRSLDHFRERLDAATGIDVYGHAGLAVGDADGDGNEDLYVPMPPGLPNLLYRALGDGRFRDVGRESGTDLLDGTSQALFLDIENDGDQDLFCVTESGIILLENEGDGRFEPRLDAVEDLEAGTSTLLSATAADYDLDGLVDVYVSSYVFWRESTTAVGSRLPVPYHEARNGAANYLFRNLGNGRFGDVTRQAGLDTDNRRFTFAAAWGDYDDDGDPDLYVANDFGSNHLFRNGGDGTFTDVTGEAGVADTGPGMSAVWEDYDNDGDLDLYVGNMFSSAGQRVTGVPHYLRRAPEVRDLLRRHARGNSLFRNTGEGDFEDVSLESHAHFGRWAWASGFIDVNLDGREDIFVQNGFITNPRVHDL